jgi:hypothetical protein
MAWPTRSALSASAHHQIKFAAPTTLWTSAKSLHADSMSYSSNCMGIILAQIRFWSDHGVPRNSRNNISDQSTRANPEDKHRPRLAV